MMAVANKALKCRLRTIHENDQTHFLRWYCENYEAIESKN